MSPFTSLLLRALYLTLLLSLLLPLFLVAFIHSPTLQSLLVHMHWVNFPFPFLTDFTQPTKAQLLTRALPCADYIRTTTAQSSFNSSSSTAPTLSGWLVSPHCRCSSSSSSSPSPSSHGPVDGRCCSSLSPFAHPVLYLHGNAENRAYHHSHDRFAFLTAFPLCADVFVFDYRGFADNAGFPTQEGLEEDARAMISTVEGWNTRTDSSTNTTGIRTDDIVVYGHSLGSAVAIHLLHSLMQEGRPTPRALIVEGAFTNVVDNALTYLPYPLDSWPWLRSTLSAALRHPWMSSSLLPLPSTDLRVLFLHGRKDSTISYWNVERLWAQVVQGRGCTTEVIINDDGQVERCDGDVLVTVDGGHHNNALSFPISRQAVIRFIDDADRRRKRDDQRLASATAQRGSR